MALSYRGDGHDDDDVAGSLLRHANDLYDDSRLMPMLRQLIRTSCRLGEAIGGSISLVDGDAGRYTKVAEYGTACELGQSFPLHEGITGKVVESRAPVVLGSYRELASGHLKAGHPAWSGSVAAIPIWWRADIVAVNVIFAGVARGYSVTEIDDLELVTQVVAPGLITAVDREYPERAALRRRPAIQRADPGAASGTAVASVNDIIAGLIEMTSRAVGEEAAPTNVSLRVLGDADTPRLLFRPEDAGERRSEGPWRELVDDESGVVAVAACDSEPGRSDSLLSSREQQVASLLGQGLSDRAIAAELFLSPKTVEKHVSAVLRKTGTTSRTAAVVTCLQHGWL
ncbi:LuxR C-terminal-related transcriptional regulator [Nostocoides sp. Soil756]|uniref:LuxR C-terminal-related transcriptional regulator n=1 Tax=Nostocoides sp. Soil756 TaxID=1736399 RepID=UPI0006FD9D58|nr:LuxR C-terminal-related transcriptional regulator [Tetrasphaera sp. Soil756]KRE60987.1 hypothetical protein ASG78_11535 [Tetrasphaera sp. Soil756]